MGGPSRGLAKGPVFWACPNSSAGQLGFNIILTLSFKNSLFFCNCLESYGKFVNCSPQACMKASFCSLVLNLVPDYLILKMSRNVGSIMDNWGSNLPKMDPIKSLGALVYTLQQRDLVNPCWTKLHQV